MKKLKIETGKENKILRAVSKSVSNLDTKTPRFDMGLSDFIKEMKRQLDIEKGLGIAAPQVGEDLQICLCKINHKDSNEMLLVMINPKITWKSWDGEMKIPFGMKAEDAIVPDGANIDEEGCLSLPGYYTNIVRANKITVDFFDGRGLLKKGVKGKVSSLDRITLNLENWNARVVQHETDHLQGVLMCDRVG